jgi:alginate O-acetyltransferase complex protein AlgI
LVFTSFEFVAFFLAVVLVQACIRNFTLEKWFLLAASYGFYISWSIVLLPVILVTSILDYRIGQEIEATDDPTRRKRLLLVSLLTSVGVLAGFKYANFMILNVSWVLGAFGVHVNPIHLNVPLPPGISYFTFASMSYVIDVYYGRLTASRSALDYALFIAYFPKLLAGPIARAVRFLPQLRQRMKASVDDIETGIAYVLIGAVKKLVISDQIAGHVNLIFSAPTEYDALTLLQGLLGYAIQIYCDFSGYSDMAIGCARIMGFRLPDNFQFPYGASSISDFWRRWHITLSEWFRDYVFIPLELATRANRNATVRASINLVTTMLLCGLWHGAGWNFVLWGGIHGVALAVHKVWTDLNLLRDVAKSGRVYQMLWAGLARLLTLATVLFGWVFFRADSVADAVSFLSRMLSWNTDGTRLLSPYILPAIAGVALAHVLFSKHRDWVEELPQQSTAIRVAAYSCLLTLVVSLGATDSVPFIYFQF